MDTSIIVILMVHVVIAATLNWLVNLIGIFSNLQVMVVYFVVLSGYYINLLNRFFLAYKYNPNAVELEIRTQLNIKKK